MNPTHIYFPSTYGSNTSINPTPTPAWLVKKVSNAYWLMADRPASAIEGQGRMIAVSELQPWSDELWQRCEQFISLRQNALKAFRKTYNELSKGILPLPLT